MARSMDSPSLTATLVKLLTSFLMTGEQSLARPRALCKRLLILLYIRAMTQRQLFGTDGIRGKANIYPITVEVMLALGRALAHWVNTHKKGSKGLIVIGKD